MCVPDGIKSIVFHRRRFHHLLPCTAAGNPLARKGLVVAQDTNLLRNYVLYNSLNSSLQNRIHVEVEQFWNDILCHKNARYPWRSFNLFRVDLLSPIRQDWKTAINNSWWIISYQQQFKSAIIGLNDCMNAKLVHITMNTTKVDQSQPCVL